jgi:hypothetical protein
LVTTSHPFNTYEAGTTTVTWKAIDSHGNVSTCSFTVTVDDTLKPVAVCRNFTARLNEAGTVNLVPFELDGGSYDRCGIRSEYLSTTTFNCSQIGRHSDTLTVVDISGNTASCTADVNVVDDLPPVAVCKPYTTELNADGMATITAADVDGGSYDNCGIASKTVSPSTFYCQEVGRNFVELTVKDASGNTSHCYTTVQVTSPLSCSIAAVPANNVYTGGVAATIYLGYGPQSVTLQTTVTGGIAAGYQWIGDGPLSCYNCAAPVFAPTRGGVYTFRVVVGTKGTCNSECNITICVIDARVRNAGSGEVYFCHNGQTVEAATSGNGAGSVAYYLANDPGDHIGGCNQQCGDGKDNASTSPVSVAGDDQFDVSVYPNPYSGEFHLKLQSSSQENINVKIFDITGKLLDEKKEITYGTDIILGNNYAVGIYLVQVNQGQTTRVLRVVKAD